MALAVLGRADTIAAEERALVDALRDAVARVLSAGDGGD
jgi:hypothetical protein